MRSFAPLRPGSRFRSIYRSGSRHRSGGITVLQSPGQQRVPEVGVVAGKGVGNAVQRNRAKRRLREAVDGVDLHPNTAYVVVASTAVLEAPFGQLAEWLEDAVASGSRIRTEDGA